jgi:hypothetical protein
LQGFHAPERTRTSTASTGHKALNLVGRVIKWSLLPYAGSFPRPLTNWTHIARRLLSRWYHAVPTRRAGAKLHVTRPAGFVNSSMISRLVGSRYPWSPNGTPGYYDVWNVAAHEKGHGVGLGHVTNTTWLTMYTSTGLGWTRHRSLGLGDARGLDALY